MKKSKKTIEKGMKVKIGVHTATIIEVFPCSGPNGEDRVALDNNFGIMSVDYLYIE